MKKLIHTLATQENVSPANLLFSFLLGIVVALFTFAMII